MGKWVLVFVIMMLGDKESAINSIKVEGFSSKKECLLAGENIKKDLTPTKKPLHTLSWKFSGDMKFSCIKIK